MPAPERRSRCAPSSARARPGRRGGRPRRARARLSVRGGCAGSCRGTPRCACCSSAMANGVRRSSRNAAPGDRRRGRFLGHARMVPRVLAASDIWLTSLWEGLPVLVQAAAAGKPIRTFDVEGAGVVRDGRQRLRRPGRATVERSRPTPAAAVRASAPAIWARPAATTSGASGRRTMLAGWTPHQRARLKVGRVRSNPKRSSRARLRSARGGPAFAHPGSCFELQCRQRSGNR